MAVPNEARSQTRRGPPRAWNPALCTIIALFLGIGSGKVMGLIALAGFVCYLVGSLVIRKPRTHFGDVLVFVLALAAVQSPVDLWFRRGPRTGVAYQRVLFVHGSYVTVRALEATGLKRDVDFTVVHIQPLLTVPLRGVIVFTIKGH